MYLRQLTVRNCKLVRELMLGLDDGEHPRMWTMLVAENGLCKTSLLRCIAAAAMGPEIASGLADVSSFPDKRPSRGELEIHATFSFSDERHHRRTYPGLAGADAPPALTSSLYARSGHTLFRGQSGYASAYRAGPNLATMSPRLTVHDSDPRFLLPLSEARSAGLRDWFVAAYGVGRILQSAASGPPATNQGSDRVASLFHHETAVLGTRFADLFESERSRHFAEALRDAFVDGEILPGVENVELRGKGGVRTAADLVEGHRFGLRAGQTILKLPATWLSQGYQAIISLVADIVGQVWLEANAEVPLSEMEGLVLIDEIDLHLHPKWQTRLVTSLRKAFPRMQFIATTHSPMMLSGMRQNEVFILRQDPSTGDVAIEPASESPQLLTASDLYRVFFGISRHFANAIGERLARYMFLATDPERNDDEDLEARDLLAGLRSDDVPIAVEPLPRVSPR